MSLFFAISVFRASIGATDHQFKMTFSHVFLRFGSAFLFSSSLFLFTSFGLPNFQLQTFLFHRQRKWLLPASSDGRGRRGGDGGSILLIHFYRFSGQFDLPCAGPIRTGLVLGCEWERASMPDDVCIPGDGWGCMCVCVCASPILENCYKFKLILFS